MRGLIGSLFVLAFMCPLAPARSAGAAEDTYRRVLRASVTTFDPIATMAGNELPVIEQMFDSLVAYDKDLRMVPRLASGWEVTKDGRIYTFRIRDAVRFSNGELMKVEDVIFSLKRVIKDPTSQFFRDFYLIKGAQDFREGRSHDVAGIRTAGENAVRIELRIPSPHFLSILASTAGSIVHVFPSPSRSSREDAPIGTGPFLLDCVNDDGVILKAHLRHFRGRPKLGRIIYRVYPVKEDAIRDFVDGKLEDIAPYSVPPGTDTSRFKRVFAQGILSFAAVLNPEYPPFDDVRVRRAFVMALDWDQILGGMERSYPYLSRSLSFIPKGKLGYNSSFKGLRHDMKAASALLQSAGYSNFSSLPQLTIFHTGILPYSDEIVNRITEQCRGIGLHVDARRVSFEEKERILSEKRWHMGLAGFDAPYADSYFLVRLFDSQSRSQWLRRDDRALDALIRQAEVTTDSMKRLSIFQELNAHIVNDAHLVPLYSGDIFDGLIQPWVNGLQYPQTSFEFTELFPVYIDGRSAGGRKDMDKEWACGNR